MIHRARFVSLGLIASAVMLSNAVSAQANLLVTSGVNCTAPSLTQIFLPWGDPAYYTLAPGGSFERSTSGWTLAGGAKVVSGNETYQVGSAKDSKSLALASGGSATSATMCVGVGDPDLRLFIRNTGSSLSTLHVAVNYETSTGGVETTTIGNFTAGSAWTPTAQTPVVVNLLALLPGNETPVSFSFTPQGASGNWQIDDVYVDPWART